MRSNLASALSALHAKAHRVATDYYLLHGFVAPQLYDLVKASASLDAFIKYDPDQPRVPAGNPDGGQWTSEGGVAGGGAPTDGITPVYPLETALLLLLGGASALGDLFGGGVAESGIGAGVGDALGTTVQDASSVTQNLVDALAPDGNFFIGEAGTDSTIRELPGGSDAAEEMFQNLTEGGTPEMPSSYKGIAGYRMPDGSWIGYRPTSKSGPATIDLNIPYFGETLNRLKFLD